MSESDYIAQVNEVLKVEAETGRTKELCDRAFALNNLRFKQEKKKWCGGCVNRVFKNLKNYSNKWATISI